MDHSSLRSYAELLAGACLGLGEGWRLHVSCEPPHREMARLVAAAAWERGVRELRVTYVDELQNRVAVERKAEAWLDEVSGLETAINERMAAEGWSMLLFWGDEDPSAMEGINPGRLQRFRKARYAAFDPYWKAMSTWSNAWCCAPFPTEAWARRAYLLSGRPAPAAPLEALWADLAPILRLDAPDPAAAWLADIGRLAKRAELLNAAPIATLRFRGPGTDLAVGLSPRSRWASVGARSTAGAFFTANIPSEEVFTTPDFRLTEGIASSTKPVNVLGLCVEGAWFRFAAGEVVDCGAARNAEVLRRSLETDPGARRLGEVAIVDADNPVGRSGLVFDNALLDENAACHIALGCGHELDFEGAEDMDAAARLAAGFNESLEHRDFMFGGEEVEVDALLRDGRSLPLMRGGDFVFGG